MLRNRPDGAHQTGHGGNHTTETLTNAADTGVANNGAMAQNPENDSFVSAHATSNPQAGVTENDAPNQVAGEDSFGSSNNAMNVPSGVDVPVETTNAQRADESAGEAMDLTADGGEADLEPKSEPDDPDYLEDSSDDGSSSIYDETHHSEAEEKLDPDDYIGSNDSEADTFRPKVEKAPGDTDEENDSSDNEGDIAAANRSVHQTFDMQGYLLISSLENVNLAELGDHGDLGEAKPLGYVSDSCPKLLG